MAKPPLGSLNDPFDFMKNLWGGMGMPAMKIPGMVMPTLSIEDLNKQIADLKAVESWLNVNMSMLRTTIQGLEVQAATISTLKSMGDSFSAVINSTAASAKTESDAAKPVPEAATAEAPAAEPASNPSMPPLPNPAAWWNMLQDQFQQAVNSALPAENSKQEQPAPAEQPQTEPAKTPSRKRKAPPKT